MTCCPASLPPPRPPNRPPEPLSKKSEETFMRLNPFKNIRLSFQLFALVVILLGVSAGLMVYAMRQVQATQGTLKHTIDNRMVSGQALRAAPMAWPWPLRPGLPGVGR